MCNTFALWKEALWVHILLQYIAVLFVCFLNAIGTTNHIHLESLVIPSVAVCMINLKIYKCLCEHLIMLPSFQSLQVC